MGGIELIKVLLAQPDELPLMIMIALAGVEMNSSVTVDCHDRVVNLVDKNCWLLLMSGAVDEVKVGRLEQCPQVCTVYCLLVDSSTLSSIVEQCWWSNGVHHWYWQHRGGEWEHRNSRQRKTTLPRTEGVRSVNWKYFCKTHKIIFCRFCEKQEFKFQFQKMESKWVETRERKISEDWAREPHSSSEDSWLSPWSGQEENQSHSTREKKSSFWITQQENNQSDQLWRDQEKDWLWEPDAP